MIKMNHCDHSMLGLDGYGVVVCYDTETCPMCALEEEIKELKGEVNNTQQLQIRATKTPDKDRVYLFGEVFDCSNITLCKRADKLKMIPAKLFAIDNVTSMCNISMKNAQHLMNDLYKIGLKPKGDK